MHTLCNCAVYVMSRVFGPDSESKDCLFAPLQKRIPGLFLLFSNTSIIVDLVSSLKRRTYCRHQKNREKRLQRRSLDFPFFPSQFRVLKQYVTIYWVLCSNYNIIFTLIFEMNLKNYNKKQVAYIYTCRLFFLRLIAHFFT